MKMPEVGTSGRMTFDPTAPITVLMYHAIFDENGTCSGADQRYSVSRAVFRKHLAAVETIGAMPLSVANILDLDTPAHCVAFTFDDGHASNASAAEALSEVGGSADFFVNSSTINTPHHLSWNALRDMVKIGASIQSHGHTHRYFDTLGDAEIRAELRTSKFMIEDRLGARVTIFAPPGGRLKSSVASLAFEVGYEAICTSSVGLWKLNTTTWNIPRFAVLEKTSCSVFQRWIKQDPATIHALNVRKKILDGGKRMLGNRGYEKMRARLLGGGSAHDDGNAS